MINHVSIGVRDIAATKRFYDAALAPLGYKCLSESDGGLGYGKGSRGLLDQPQQRPVPTDRGIRFAFLSRCADARERRCLSCGGVARGRTRQRQAGFARGLRRELLRRLCDRSRRLSARGLLRRGRLTARSIASYCGAAGRRGCPCAGGGLPGLPPPKISRDGFSSRLRTARSITVERAASVDHEAVDLLVEIFGRVLDRAHGVGNIALAFRPADQVVDAGDDAVDARRILRERLGEGLDVLDRSLDRRPDFPRRRPSMRDSVSRAACITSCDAVGVAISVGNSFSLRSIAGAAGSPPLSASVAMPVRPWNSSDTLVSARSGVPARDRDRHQSLSRIGRVERQRDHFADADAVEIHLRAGAQARRSGPGTPRGNNCARRRRRCGGTNRQSRTRRRSPQG